MKKVIYSLKSENHTPHQQNKENKALVRKIEMQR